MKATFIYEGRSIHHLDGDDLSDFPKKNTTYNIDGKDYFIQGFSLIGMTIIYILN